MWVLSFCLKVGLEFSIFISLGSLLYNLGAWYSKHLSELDRLDMIGSWRRPILRSWKPDACPNGLSSSDTYDGWPYLRTLKTNKHILNSIRALTGKKWSCIQIGVILTWENLGKLTTSLAALFNIIWRGWSTVLGRPKYRELQKSICDKTREWTSCKRWCLSINEEIWEILTNPLIDFCLTLLIWSTRERVWSKWKAF